MSPSTLLFVNRGCRLSVCAPRTVFLFAAFISRSAPLSRDSSSFSCVPDPAAAILASKNRMTRLPEPNERVSGSIANVSDDVDSVHVDCSSERCGPNGSTLREFGDIVKLELLARCSCRPGAWFGAASGDSVRRTLGPDQWLLFARLAPCCSPSGARRGCCALGRWVGDVRTSAQPK